MRITAKKCLFLLALTIILMEVVQLSDAYKSIKSLKYHRQKHWGRRPHWHAFPRVPKRGLRRGRFKYRYHHDQYPERHSDYHINPEPFTIELELPERHDDRVESWKKSRYNYRYVVAEPYEEEKQKVRIKVLEKDKSHIRLKISRDDNQSQDKIVNIHDNTFQIESIPYSKTPIQPAQYSVPIVHTWKDH